MDRATSTPRPPGSSAWRTRTIAAAAWSIPDEYVARVAALARRVGVPIHLDGARLFNASVATGKPLTAWTQHVTTVMLSFSKGLSAPVGSIVAGPREVIARVRKARKMLGGAMRQVGVLAAAALVALDEMVPRLAEDHANARAAGRRPRCLAGHPARPVERRDQHRRCSRPRRASIPPSCSRASSRKACSSSAWAARLLRAVTHYGITAADCEAASKAFVRVLERSVPAMPSRPRR